MMLQLCCDTNAYAQPDFDTLVYCHGYTCPSMTCLFVLRSFLQPALLSKHARVLAYTMLPYCTMLLLGSPLTMFRHLAIMVTLCCIVVQCGSKQDGNNGRTYIVCASVFYYTRANLGLELLGTSFRSERANQMWGPPRCFPKLKTFLGVTGWSIGGGGSPRWSKIMELLGVDPGFGH